jgi:hypothetical protein
MSVLQTQPASYKRNNLKYEMQVSLHFPAINAAQKSI